jgi:hypothetical protein
MNDEHAQLAGHGDALLHEAVQRLVDTAAPYGVLTRQNLEILSGADRWHSVRFEHALRWAVEHGMLRRLSADLYEVPTTNPGAPSAD